MDYGFTDLINQLYDLLAMVAHGFAEEYLGSNCP
jgi:hypothetical protein